MTPSVEQLVELELARIVKVAREWLHEVYETAENAGEVVSLDNFVIGGILIKHIGMDQYEYPLLAASTRSLYTQEGILHGVLRELDLRMRSPVDESEEDEDEDIDEEDEDDEKAA